jgi:hypothetical protein
VAKAEVVTDLVHLYHDATTVLSLVPGLLTADFTRGNLTTLRSKAPHDKIIPIIKLADYVLGDLLGIILNRTFYVLNVGFDINDSVLDIVFVV